MDPQPLLATDARSLDGLSLGDSEAARRKILRAPQLLARTLDLTFGKRSVVEVLLAEVGRSVGHRQHVPKIVKNERGELARDPRVGTAPLRCHARHSAAASTAGAGPGAATGTVSASRARVSSSRSAWVGSPS